MNMYMVLSPEVMPSTIKAALLMTDVEHHFVSPELFIFHISLEFSHVINPQTHGVSLLSGGVAGHHRNDAEKENSFHNYILYII